MARVTTELDIELAKWNAKTAQIKADMRQLSAAAKKENVGDAFTGKIQAVVAGVSVAGTVAALRSVAGTFDEISDAADKMGESTDTIQRIKFAAEQSGSSIDALSGGFIKLEKALGDVENSKARDALADMGLTAEQLAAMPLDEKLIAFSAAFEKAREKGTGVNDIMTLLGKSAADLIPLLSQGEEGIRAMLADAPVLASEAVDALAQLNDEMDALGARATATGGKVAVGLSLLVEGAMKSFKTNADYVEKVMEKGGFNPLKMAIVALTNFGEASDGFDKVLTGLGDEMNERSEESSRRRRRPKVAPNTDDNAAAKKEQEDAAKAEAKAAKDAEDAAEKAAKEEEDRQKRIVGLQQEIEDKRISLLPPAEQLTEFKTKLQNMLEDVDFVNPTMQGLDEQIRMSQDPEEQERLLRIKKEALEMEANIARLEKADAPQEETQRSARTPGSVAAAMNTIFGRSANELVLDESKRQTQVLERIDKGIQKLAGNGQSLGAESDTFIFP
jgi:hypothetical protein